MVYDKDLKFHVYIVKAARKVRRLTESARSPSAEIFKMLCSFDMLVSKNTKWPICAIYLQAHRTQVNGLGLTVLVLGLVVYWLCESQDSLQPFSRWITVPLETRPDAKCVRYRRVGLT